MCLGGVGMKDGSKINYSLDFCVKCGSVIDTFLAMKQCQELGVADREASITFNGICLPAGYYDEFNDYFRLYSAVLHINVSEVVESLPKDLSPVEASRALQMCALGMQDYGEVLSYSDIDSIIEERYCSNVKKIEKYEECYK